MTKRIVLLSGHVASGKTTLVNNLASRYGFLAYKTVDFIRELKQTESERAALQAAGDALDSETAGKWVADVLAQRLSNAKEDSSAVIDSVRIRAQCDGVRRAFGPRVVHIHLVAPLDTLAARYGRRDGAIRELSSYDEVLANKTEAAVDDLVRIADVVIDTGTSTPEDVVVRAASRLGLYERGNSPLVDVLVGGQWGSEGKGNVAAYLAPEYDVLLRVGGPNAGHKVYGEPRPVTYHHLPSGTSRARHATLVIGPGSTIWPPTLLEEIKENGVETGRLKIDPQAMIIDAADRQIEQTSLRDQIGSTAQGVGVATSRKVLRTAAEPAVMLAKDSRELKPYICETREVLDDAFANGKRVFLEGTQGTGLSLHHGEYPYVTSRDTTASGCLADAGIPPSRVRRSIMVCRTYPIRVANPSTGTSGSMYDEIDWGVVAERSRLKQADIEAAEKTTTTGRDRRVAEFSWALLRRAASLNGPTDIALSFTDYLDAANRQARRFDQLTSPTIQFIEEVESVCRAPVSLIVTRFDYRNIIDRRSW
jgi:adenylosuccinate synthase